MEQTSKPAAATTPATSDSPAKTPAEPKESWADVVEEEEQQKAAQVAKGLTNLSVASSETGVDAPLPSVEKRATGLQRGGKLIVEQNDPNSPLFSVKSFEELPLTPELRKGIYGMGFNKPSKIQESALPVIIGNNPQNLIAQAQSGTGKTAAFVLCMLSRADPNVQAPQAVCICPTRELARQIVDNVKAMGAFTKLETTLVVKDEVFPKKITSQIVAGTPGKMFDLLRSGVIDSRKVKVFVLDEADVMMDRQGLGEQSIKIKKLLPKNCQVLLFSATFKPVVREFASKVVGPNRVDIRLKRKQLTLEGIQQLYIDCKNDKGRFTVLSDIYGYLSVGQSIIFVQTRNTATELTKQMLAAGHTVSLLHGGEDMSSAQRDKVIDDFRDGRTKVLITTNVLARGIDIPQVMLVINYDLPLNQDGKPDTETYLHRIGRSGRFGKKGIAINFVYDQQSMRNLKLMEEFFGRPINQFDANKIENIQPMLEALLVEEAKIEEMRAKGQIKDEDDEDEDEEDTGSGNNNNNTKS